MKKCPYCAEEIQDEAIKCKHCEEFLGEKPKTQGKWFHKTSAIIIAFLCFGPFAIPLVWMNPNYDRKKKIIITLIMLVLSYLLIFYFIKGMRSLNDYYQKILQIR